MPTAIFPAVSTTPPRPRIEAESVKAIMEKFNASNDAVFKERAVFIKEERADLVKHHLWVLWTDYFKPEHLEKYPELHGSVLGRHQGCGRVQEDNRRRRRSEIARPDRRDRQDLLGDEEGLSPQGARRTPPCAHPPETGGSTASSSPSLIGSSRPAGSPLTQIALEARTAAKRGPKRVTAASSTSPTVPPARPASLVPALSRAWAKRRSFAKAQFSAGAW